MLETDVEQVRPYVGEQYITTITGIENGTFNYTCILKKADLKVEGYMKKVKSESRSK